MSHTGGAMGASSILLILPRLAEDVEAANYKDAPQGVVVAMVNSNLLRDFK